MPDRLLFVGAVSGGALGASLGAVDVRLTGTGAQASVRISDYGGGNSYVLAPNGSGDFTAGAATPMSGSGRVDAILPDRTGATLDPTAIDDAFDIWDAGGRGSIDVQLSNSAFYGDRAALIAMRVGSTDMVYVSRASGDGVSAFAVDSNGDLTRIDTETDTAKNYMKGIASLASADLGNGQRYLFAGSALEDGISVLAVLADGSFQHIGHLGALHQLPIRTVTALDTVSIDGTTFLIAASAGTSSLSVMQVAPDGTLTVTDHVIDGRNTRFSGVTEMATIEIDGRVFVAVSGNDDGITLLTLSAAGHLIHLNTIADSTTTALGGVSGLALVETSRGIEIITTSARDGGVNHFRVDLDPFTQSGLAGDDIISDGQGTQTLQGGAGDDLFFLTEDGEHDVIEGIVLGEDQIDLSGWSLFYDISQLDISSRNWGAELQYGSETLELRTANGQSLGGSDISALLAEGVHRVGISQVSTIQTSTLDFPDRVVSGGTAAEFLRGSNDEDKITGGDGNDQLSGRAGNDTLSGGRGDDTLDGGTGDDYLIDVSGRDTFIGGTGDDTVSYYGRANGIFVSLRSGDNNSGDTFSSIESVNGSNTGRDTLIGSFGDNRLRGFGGDDTINGSRGNDTLEGGNGDDYLLDKSGADIFNGGAGRDMASYTGRANGLFADLGTGRNNSGDTYISIEDLRGSDGGADTLIGDAGNNRLEGEGGHDRLDGSAGNDTLVGGSGNDFLTDHRGQDFFVGGSGRDTVSYYGRGAGVEVNLINGENNSGDRYSSIEAVFGSNNGSDNLYGNNSNNRLRGFNGNDTLSGGRGDDTLDGGTGDDYLIDVSGRDTFIGGTGDDTVSYYGRANGIFVSLRSGDNNSGDTFSSIESVNGSNTGRDTLIGSFGDNRLRGFGGDDTINGSRGNDTLEGGNGDDYLLDKSGADIFNGGAGRDMASYTGRANGLFADLGTGRNNSGDTYISIEDLRGSDGGADTLIGDAGNNRLEGEGGHDRLDGAAGNDTLVGGSGNDFLADHRGQDFFVGGSGRDTVSYYGRGAGVEVNLINGENNSGDRYSSIEAVIGSNNGSDRLVGNSVDNHLSGHRGNDRIEGGRGNDTLVGGAGNDYLIDASGRDIFSGGSGSDTVSYLEHRSGVRVNLATGENSSGDSYSSIEHLYGSSTAGDTLTGDDGSNRLWGFGGWDVINGGDGNDRIEGGSGNDTLTGGSGADVFVFEQGDGRDRITDFNIAQDSITFDITALEYDDLFIRNSWGGAHINYGSNMIIIYDLDANDLNASHFDFI